jgi:HIV-1 Vpr-binding protein
VFQEDDDFFELLSSRLLVDPVHATKIRAAALRLLLACVSSWMVCGHGRQFVKLFFVYTS